MLYPPVFPFSLHDLFAHRIRRAKSSGRTTRPGYLARLTQILPCPTRRRRWRLNGLGTRKNGVWASTDVHVVFNTFIPSTETIDRDADESSNGTHTLYALRSTS